MNQGLTDVSPLSTAVGVYLAARTSDGYSPATLKGYGYQLRRLREHLGDQPIKDITLEDLRASVNRLLHLKATSRGFVVRSYRAFFRWLHEEDVLARNPAIRLREPKQPQRVPKFLPLDSMELLRDSCRTPLEHALIEFLFATGCRIGEVQRTSVQDIDWQRKSVMVLGKGNKEREVYFGSRANIWLRRYLDSRTDDCSALFASTRRQRQSDGSLAYQRLSISQLGVYVKRVANRCQLGRRVSAHVLRHTLATYLLNQGAPLVVVQSTLGHTKPDTTQLYATLSGAAREQAYRRYFVQ